MIAFDVQRRRHLTSTAISRLVQTADDSPNLERTTTGWILRKAVVDRPLHLVAQGNNAVALNLALGCRTAFCVADPQCGDAGLLQRWNVVDRVLRVREAGFGIAARQTGMPF